MADKMSKMVLPIKNPSTGAIANKEFEFGGSDNAINAEATARQSADNTLQGNINSEAATRASADSNLQSQINQIIAPSGEAPSAAEVQNARIGADGATYDTLGNAIRGQVVDLKNTLNIQTGRITQLDSAVFENANITLAAWNTPGWYSSNGNKYTTEGYVNSKNEVIGGSTILIHYYSYYSATYAILDANNNILGVGESADSISAPDHTAWIDVSFELPSNAKYIALSSGSTAGEISARSETYINTINTSGSKIAENSSNIDVLIKNIGKLPVEEMTLTMNENSVLLNSTGKIITNSDYAGFEVSDLIEIEENSFYKITASSLYISHIFYAIYDEDENVLVKSETGTSTETSIERMILTPADAKYIAIMKSPNGSEPSIKAMGFYPIEDKLNGIAENGFLPNDFTAIGNKCIASSWTIVDAGTYDMFVASIPVVGVDKVRITSATNYGNPKYAWQNSNGTITAIVPAGSTGLVVTDKVVVDVPAGASTLIVNGISSIPTELETIQTIPKRCWLGKKWATIGDSLTNYNQRAYKHYFTFIAWKTGLIVNNYGISDVGYAKGKDSNKAFYQTAATVPTDSDVITIFGSFNDLASGLQLGTKTDNTDATIAGCVNLCLDALMTRIPLANIGVIAPCPWEQYTPMGSSQAAIDYVGMLKDICEYRGIPFLDLFRTSALRPWESSYRAIAYTHDGGSGTHPDDTGHKILSTKIETFLNQLLLT